MNLRQFLGSANMPSARHTNSAPLLLGLLVLVVVVVEVDIGRVGRLDVVVVVVVEEEPPAPGRRVLPGTARGVVGLLVLVELLGVEDTGSSSFSPSPAVVVVVVVVVVDVDCDGRRVELAGLGFNGGLLWPFKVRLIVFNRGYFSP